MAEYGENHRDFAVFETDISASTYLRFRKQFPDRYFNMGLAEANAVGAAAGMAASGRQPWSALTGIPFHAGIGKRCAPSSAIEFGRETLRLSRRKYRGVDGVTHQATEDIAIMSTLPNMKVIVPADPVSCSGLFASMMSSSGPVYARLMRDPLYDIYEQGEEFPMGGSKVLREGRDITIVAYGDMVSQVLLACDELENLGIKPEVIDAYSIKPLDLAGILGSVEKTGACLVVENHQRRNGLGYELSSHLVESDGIVFDIMALEDTFGETGAYEKLLKKFGLSAGDVAAKAGEMMNRKMKRTT
jgi:transketolase